ncbi:response regulator transcription factor [Lachnoclostridium sp. Marseille-P6806]|uniref:response regulator transcription factor n=1 Tax=Lachnoclostridium sp. Marseille-P6806 TaxID=2364793 RepID=UPI00103160D3|nr:response regulator [Lachnoclostridium sp. Marseille-P6806]
MPYSVIIAEDEPLLLENLAKKIDASDTDFHVVGKAQTGVQALALIEQNAPDLLVTDIRMPVMSGLELIEKIRDTHPDLDCIVVSGYSDFEYARTALHYQVLEYLLKPIDQDALLAALHRLQERNLARQHEMAQAFSRSVSAKPPEQIAALLREYLCAHFHEDVNFNLIAAQMNYSASYLTKIFDQQYGTTPGHFLILLRIRKAKQLLANHPEINIRQVGEAVGYPEQAYFSRIFKKQTGLSPLEYREALSS